MTTLMAMNPISVAESMPAMRPLTKPLIPEFKRNGSTDEKTTEKNDYGWMGKFMLAGTGSPILGLLRDSQFQNVAKTVATKGYSIYDANPRLREQLKDFSKRLDVVFDIVKKGLKSKSKKTVCAAGRLAKSALDIEASILDLLDTKLKQALAHGAGDLYWYISEISRYEAALSLELGLYIARARRLTEKVVCDIHKKDALELLKNRKEVSGIERIADDITGVKGLMRRHARLEGLKK